MVTYTEDDKGSPVAIVGGTYCGYKGWLWKDKAGTVKSVYVILSLGDGKEKGVRLHKQNVEVRQHDSPRNYIEAAFEQHPDLAKDLNKLCRKLAKCNIQDSGPELYEKIDTKIKAAYQQQLAEGANATWYHVEWEADDIGGDDDDM